MCACTWKVGAREHKILRSKEGGTTVNPSFISDGFFCGKAGKANMDKKILDYSRQLTELGIDHNIVEHPDLRTPEEVQGFLDLTLADGLATLIMKADGGFIAVLRRNDCQLDFEKIKTALGIGNLNVAKEDDFVKATGDPVGAARPYYVGMKTVIDKKIFEKEYLTGGTGSFVCSFRYKAKDLTKIPGSIVLDVTQEQKTSAVLSKRVFSGIRATGRLHLGNYLGAVKGMLELTDKYDCIFGVVDLHTITTPYDPTTLQKNIYEVVLDYLGAGLDPKRCKIVIQSRIPEHIELSYLLATIYQVARLEDLPTYKEKKLLHPDYINMGLLYYPVLMASDILLYKAGLVPVGIDQEPHLEVTREIARKFNTMYGNTFPEPIRFATKINKVPSLTGEGKMSKSVSGSSIYLTDDLETINKRVAAMPTDAGGPGEVPTTGPVANFFQYLYLFCPDKVPFYKEEYQNGKIRYSEVKKVLAEAIFEMLKPIQEKRKYFEDRPEEVKRILDEGVSGARKIAQDTLTEVKKKMGLI